MITVKAGNFVWSLYFVHLHTEYLKIRIKSCFTDINFFQIQTCLKSKYTLFWIFLLNVFLSSRNGWFCDEIKFSKIQKRTLKSIWRNKNWDFFFYSCHIQISGQDQNCFQNYFIFFIKVVGSCDEISRPLSSVFMKLNYKISVISDRHMLRDEIRLSHVTVRYDGNFVV